MPTKGRWIYLGLIDRTFLTVAHPGKGRNSKRNKEQNCNDSHYDVSHDLLSKNPCDYFLRPVNRLAQILNFSRIYKMAINPLPIIDNDLKLLVFSKNFAIFHLGQTSECLKSVSTVAF